MTALLVSLITLLTLTASASGYDAELYKQKIAVLKNSASIEIISEVRQNIWKQYGDEVYPDDYAGAYIDDENNLVICYTPGNKSKMTSFYNDSILDKSVKRFDSVTVIGKKSIVDKLVSFVEPPFSYNYLYSLNDSLVDCFEEFKVVKTALNEETNTVDIYL